MSIPEMIAGPPVLKKRLNLFRNFWKQNFGSRVQKIPVNAGFSCPNRDGTLSYSGCSYCLNEAFSPFYCDSRKPLEKQIQDGMQFFGKKYKANKFLVFFQSFSGTHAPTETLRTIFSIPSKFSEVAGIVIATRPDCLNQEKLALLSELAKTQFVGIELGIESFNNSTLTRINRGHTYERTIETIELTKDTGIHVGGHLILGLPGENSDDYFSAARILSCLNVHFLKIHQLQILKGTRFAEEFAAKPDDFNLFSLEDYILLLGNFLERLSPTIMIDRLSAQAPRHLLLGPTWNGLKGGDLLPLLEKSLENRNIWQGTLA